MNQQITDYLQQNKASYSKEDLAQQLRNSGYVENEIQEAVNVVYGAGINLDNISVNKKAKTGLVLGIIGMLVWFFPLIGIPITIFGLIFSIKGLKSLKRGIAIVGIVLSSIGLFATITTVSLNVYEEATGEKLLVNMVVRLGVKYAVHKMKTQSLLPAPLPYKNNGSTLIDITAESKTIRSHIVLSEAYTNKEKTEILNDIHAVVCESNSARNLLNKGLILEYSFSVKNSTDNFILTYTKADCNN